MGLRLRFNLVLTAVFLVGIVASGYISYELLQAHARDEVIRSAQLMIESARAIRSYTIQEVRPRLNALKDGKFHPPTVPAFAATETLKRLPKTYHEYIYKEATLNPTNPRDRATDWEADLVRQFQRDDAAKFLSGERTTPTGRALYIASPIRITNRACLSCHGKPNEAPQSMLGLYGTSNGFGWKHNEVVGAQVVSVPMAVAIEKADRVFFAFLVSLCLVFLVLYVVLNVMLGRMIIRPIAVMSNAADEISTGNFDIPEFPARGNDEIGRLGNSFNRMRRSLEQAMRMIDR